MQRVNTLIVRKLWFSGTDPGFLESGSFVERCGGSLADFISFFLKSHVNEIIWSQ